MAGEDRLYGAALGQGGALRVETLDELLAAASTIARLPAPGGKRLGIVTSSGSLGVLATDEAVREGLELPPLPDEVKGELSGSVPEWMNLRNPLDVGPSPYFATALRAMLASPAVDMVLAVTVIPYAVLREWEPLGMDAKAWFGDIASLREEFPYKPLAVCAVGNSAFVRHMRETVGPRVPVLTSPETAARAMAMLYGLRLPS
jgi:acetyltransferase